MRSRPAVLPRGLWRKGLVVNLVLLTITLIVPGSVAVGAVAIWAAVRQVERTADQRLIDGAALFRSSLEDRREALSSVAEWLAQDPRLVTAVRERRAETVHDVAAFALRLPDLDEIRVAAEDGSAVALLRRGGQPSMAEDVDRRPARPSHQTDRATYGIGIGAGGVLLQSVELPIDGPSGAGSVGGVRAASFLDDRDLARFRARTGLEASLFYGEARVVTTLRREDGTPLVDVGPDPDTWREVVEGGEERLAWRDLPIGRIRSYTVPLDGPDGTRVGMLSVALPARAILGEQREVLLPVLATVAIILLAGILFTYLLARRVRQPVRVLVEAAARLRGGDLETPIPNVEEAELAQLAEELELARRSVGANLQASAREEARQQAMFAALRDPIVTTSPDGRVSDFNKAATALLGPAVRLYGRPIRELLPFLSPESEERNWQGHVTDVAGRTLDVEVSRTRLEEAHLPAADVYVLHDVSRHAELNRLREELLYNVAHELRGPLAVLDNALEILATEYAELSTREFDELTRSARRTSGRLRALMEDLLSAGSIQSGRFQVRPRPTVLSAPVDEALQASQDAVTTRNQRVACELPPDHVLVLADPRYARQVLVNLLTNAAKYSPAGEVITVRAERTDGQVRLTVEDRGPGIHGDSQAGLFERFYRVRAGNDEPGVGLGLSIARGIVEAHGGTIGVESEVGSGTSVWFTLPLANGAE